MAGRKRLGTLAAYGPDASRATKLVAAVLPDERAAQPTAMETWTVTEGDVREDRAVRSQVMAFFAMHGVRESVSADRIIGCPHQEGIDYPMGRQCPDCPFWAGIDRFTHEPIRPPVAKLSVEEVLERLAIAGPEPPRAALASADAHREALVEPLLSILDRGIEDPRGTAADDAVRFDYALYLLAKWRETRAYPYVIRWLSLPEEGAHAISGDVAAQDGARMLAAVCDGDLAPIQQLIVNLEADELCRDVAVGALALLAAWGEVPRDEIVACLASLEREGLEREPGQVWLSLAAACADLAAVELFPAMRQAFGEGLIDRESMHPSELDEVERTDPDVALEKLRERWPPIDDVADATSWWAARTQRPRNRPGEPLRVEKIGRNESCPCGSGRKYKKCCGQ